MMHKVFDWVVTILAVVGFFIFMGAVGTMDIMVEKKIDYPLLNTIKTALPGLLCMIPAIVREVL